MNKWDKYNQLLDELPPISFCGPKEAWLKILEEEKLREKCHEEQILKKDEDVKSQKSQQNKDTMSECSERPDGIVKEYVMLPIKVDCSTE